MALTELLLTKQNKAPKKGTLLSTVLLRRGWDSNPRTPYDVTSLAGNFERGNLAIL